MDKPDVVEIRREHRQIGSYLGLGFLAFYLALPSGGFANIPLQIILKDHLKLGPEQISFFQLLIAAPTYVSFLFGFVRDRWSPFHRGDRGYLLLFGLFGALGYGAIATGDPGYWRLLVGSLAATTAFRFLSSSMQGLTSEVGKRRGMTGRLSVLFNITSTTLAGISYFIGGWISDHLVTWQIYALLAALTLTFAALSFWKPRAVFEAEPGREAAARRSPWADIAATLRHRPIWPAAAIWLLWSFAPGFATPLLFYFTEHLKGTAGQFGFFNGIFAMSFLPTFLLYGWLCSRVRLGKLLLWGTLVAVPQMFPLLFLRNAEQAMWCAVPIGLLGGVATGAYYDLILRASPKGLEGTGTMLAEAGYFIALRFGDLLGAKIYASGGFAVTAWITTGVYALILPTLLLVPRHLLAGRDSSEEEEARIEAEMTASPTAVPLDGPSTG